MSEERVGDANAMGSGARLAVLGLVVGFLALGADALYRARPRSAGGSERTDLPCYLAGSERVWRGEDPLGAAGGRGWTYVYPPTLAVLLVPLLPLPALVAAGAWFALSAAALALGLVRLRSALEVRGPPDRWELLALGCLVLPATSALLRGQVGPLLVGLIGVALDDLRRARPVRAGLLIALAAAIKLTPGVLFLGLVATRSWRALAAGVAGLALWLVVLPAPFLGPLGGARSTARFVQAMVLRPAGDPDGYVAPGLDRTEIHLPKNQSLHSHIVRRTGPGPVRAVLLGALGLLILPPLVLLARRADPDPGLLGLLLGWTLLAAPIAWHHHHLVFAPVLLALAVAARRGARTGRLGLAAFAALSLLHFAVEPLRPLGLMGWGTLAAGVALARVCQRPSAAAPAKKS